MHVTMLDSIVRTRFELLFSKICCKDLRPVTSLGHQEGREGLKFFELCPTVLNHVQHILQWGRKLFLGGASPPPDYGPEKFRSVKQKCCNVSSQILCIAPMICVLAVIMWIVLIVFFNFPFIEMYKVAYFCDMFVVTYHFL